MTGEQLIAEGRRLARPCNYLRTIGKNFAGVWRGKGIIPCENGPYRHWLTVDCKYIPGSGTRLSGCLSIYTNPDDSTAGIVAVDDSLSLPDSADGDKLYAHPDSSLPPLEAVFKLGSPEIRDWLVSNNWQSEWGYNDNFPERTPAEAYERAYQDQLPLFTGAAHAVLGGWHMPWPEGDWDELLEKRLIAWTFAESEPWIEVWEDQRRFRVIQRIT